MSKEIEKREREPVDGAAAQPDYDAESTTVADDLRAMLDGYTPEDVAFALLRPRDPIKDSM